MRSFHLFMNSFNFPALGVGLLLYFTQGDILKLFVCGKYLNSIVF